MASEQLPVGSVCVIRDEQLLSWTVAICHGTDYRREVVGRFASESEAVEFAKVEQRRRNDAGKGAVYALRVDDCPCNLRGRL